MLLAVMLLVPILRRLEWRLAALGAAGIGVSYVGLRTALDDDFDLYNIGAARFESFTVL